jgi:hypothetical protein
MTSYKSAHAFENMQASGLPGRPPLPKNATPNISIGSPSSHSHNHNNTNNNNDTSTTHEGTPTPKGRKRSDSTTSTSFFGHQSFSHPHSIGQLSSSAALSTSVVREQSLALGNLERRQSFDSEAIISPGSNNNITSLSWASTANATGSPSGQSNNNVSSNDFGHRLPANSTSNNRKRDGGDRSPPSGLSLLLKTKDQEDSKDKSQSSSRSSDTSASSGTGAGSLGRKNGPLSPPPAPIDTKVTNIPFLSFLDPLYFLFVYAVDFFFLLGLCFQHVCKHMLCVGGLVGVCCSAMIPPGQKKKRKRKCYHG